MKILYIFLNKSQFKILILFKHYYIRLQAKQDQYLCTAFSSAKVSDSNIKRLMEYSLGGDITNDV